MDTARSAYGGLAASGGYGPLVPASAPQHAGGALAVTTAQPLQASAPVARRGAPLGSSLDACGSLDFDAVGGFFQGAANTTMGMRQRVKNREGHFEEKVLQIKTDQNGHVLEHYSESQAGVMQQHQQEPMAEKQMRYQNATTGVERMVHEHSMGSQAVRRVVEGNKATGEERSTELTRGLEHGNEDIGRFDALWAQRTASARFPVANQAALALPSGMQMAQVAALVAPPVYVGAPQPALPAPGQRALPAPSHSALPAPEQPAAAPAQPAVVRAALEQRPLPAGGQAALPTAVGQQASAAAAVRAAVPVGAPAAARAAPQAPGRPAATLQGGYAAPQLGQRQQALAAPASGAGPGPALLASMPAAPALSPLAPSRVVQRPAGSGFEA